MYYRKYKLNKQIYSDLSKEERLILKILEEVVKDTASLYELQLKEGFYPKGITKGELEHAAIINPEILFPFTYVERKNGKLEAIPYSIHYFKYLRPIANKLQKAAELCTNKSFKLYLEARAQSMIEGNVKEGYEAWVKVKNSKLDFNVGPFETHLDKLLGIKRAFQAFVGLINKEYTRLAEQYKEALYSSAKLSFSKYHSTEIAKRGVSVFVESIPMIAGYPADVLSSGEHFPQDLDLALKYGARTVIYASQIRLKFEKLYYPIFKTIFEPRFASRYSKQLLLEATGWSILLYELGKQLHKFEGARERLQELYPPIDEANGFASGIEHSKHLVVKGLISQEQLEAIMIIHIVWMITDWLLYKQNIAKQAHITGNSILLNSYLSNGALKESSGISWPNFSRIFFEIETIAYKLVYLLQKGSYKETERFIKKNANLKTFDRFSKALSKINTSV
ncbi:MAG: hypothetical protein AAB414_02920 [Patescibacteria group bacterium]